MSKAVKRLMKDIANFNANRPGGIYIYYDPKNVMDVYAMIMGPEDTPYFGGYFFVKLTFSDRYPFNPPKGTFLTTDGKVRFNPNLYSCGKICLSLLGTWAGPKWVPTLNLITLLISIQSLMGENPINNEPGYVNMSATDKKAIDYKLYVAYNTYKIAIDSVINKKAFNNYYNMFENEIISNYEKNKEKLLMNALKYAETYGKHQMSTFYVLKSGCLDMCELVDLVI
jgi:ubiquitin-protein ligase